jgi:hypothetical protein
VTVQVDYYVTTADSQLALGYSRIQHHITKSIELNLSSGVANTINIVIGLYSVKMAATVSEWNNVE